MYQPTRGIGGSIEEYQLEKHLGKGGFADVFQAREAKTQARVAIKRVTIS
jgi:serine/threonine protein kinase